MDDCRPRKIKKAHFIEETATPFPACLERVDQRGQDEGEQKERPQLDTLGQRAGHDRRGRCAEHQLEEIVRTRRGVGQVVSRIGRDADSLENGHADDAGQDAVNRPGAERVHQVVADHIVTDGGNREERHILGQLHGCVLGADKAGFQHAEAAGHEHDEHAANQEQQRVQDEYTMLGHFLCESRRCHERADTGECEG